MYLGIYPEATLQKLEQQPYGGDMSTWRTRNRALGHIEVMFDQVGYQA